jgi:hypothetical protein
MRNTFKLYDLVQIKPEAEYIRPEFHGQTGKIIALFHGELGGNLAVMKFDHPYTHPVFVNPIATITIGLDLLDRAV